MFPEGMDTLDFWDLQFKLVVCELREELAGEATPAWKSVYGLGGSMLLKNVERWDEGIDWFRNVS